MYDMKDAQDEDALQVFDAGRAEPLPGEPDEVADFRAPAYDITGGARYDARFDERSDDRFDDHRRRAEEEYLRRVPLYEDFAASLSSILRAALDAAGITVHSIESRAKDVESFGRKATQSSLVDSRRPRYESPLTEVTDLAGVRVLTYFLQDVADIDELIAAELDVLDMTNEPGLLGKTETFGYESAQYVVQLRPERCALPEYNRFAGLIAEVQVRTILQHAWAEIERGIPTPSPEALAAPTRRRLSALAGMLEVADREFQSVQRDDAVQLDRR
jgi:ppGpp synthetase/RelA/SpoT-type nucleotidyltranferase